MKNTLFLFLLILTIAACDFGSREQQSNARTPLNDEKTALDRSLIDRHPDSPLLITPQHEPESAFIERMKHLTRTEPLYHKDDYEGLMNEGLDRYRAHEYIEAIKSFSNAIDADPTQADAYYYRGQVFIDINNFPAAKNDFLRVTSKVEDDPEAWNFLGYTQALEGDNESAIESYNKAINLNPDNAMYYYNRGGSLAKLDQLEDALDDFDAAISLGTQTSGVFNNRANTKYLLGDYRGAISDYTRAMRLDPEGAAPYANRGFSYLFTGDTARACSDWRRADELGHPMVKGYMQLYCK